MLFFFFKQKSAYELRISDWSSDVCSSDLVRVVDVSFMLHVEALLKARRWRPGPDGHSGVNRNSDVDVFGHGSLVAGIVDGLVFAIILSCRPCSGSRIVENLFQRPAHRTLLAKAAMRV